MIKSVFAYSDLYSKYSYPGGHPFDLGRADRVYGIMKEQGLLDGDWMKVVEPDEISEKLLLRAHDEEYLELLKKANKGGEITLEMLEHGLGTEDCPVMKGIYDLHALAAGATFKVVQLVETGGEEGDDIRFGFNPMGGFHHAGRAHAGGFCYLNDINVAIYEVLKKGRRVAYVDLDAHHGDGVQEAFYQDNRVLVISLHESGKYIFPGTGFETEIGEGPGKGYNVNVPLEIGVDDEVYFYAFNEVVPPLLWAFQPELVISLMGGDILANDPVANLHMTNNVMADCAAILDHICPRWVCLGSGGYNLENTARAWALVWATVNGIETMEEDLSTLGGVFLGDVGIGVQGLRDMHSYTSGPDKEYAYNELDRVLEYIRKEVFPVLGAQPE